ncbi:hypothetical protein [Bacillus sp. UMB0893]|uniref:hypothetical protein n=1 Tax=Bacillus sp. UMB0893 TaxID=2066053 RepID=UPI0021532778|nr:hypothetical protein [Bacillus sp. UMB0893]
MSKIERGITEYSDEITYLLSKQLKIDLKSEVARYNSLNEKLSDWHEAMIMQRTREVESLKAEIEQETLKDLPDYLTIYRLLLSKYEKALELFPQNIKHSKNHRYRNNNDCTA